MKRKPEDNSSATFGNILTAASPELRAWIGAVVLAYNEAQSALHKLAAKSLAFVVIGQSYAVTSRINGTAGLIEIIKQAVEALQLPPEQSQLFDITLSEDGFANLKKLRDAVIHSELLDSGTKVAVAPGARGARQEVLLSPDTLKGLYERLVVLTKEFVQLETIISCQKIIKIYPILFGAIDDQRRLQNEQDIQEATTLCQSHQNQRLSLPPFPKFPEPPNPDALMAEWLSSLDTKKKFSIRIGPKKRR